MGAASCDFEYRYQYRLADSTPIRTRNRHWHRHRQSGGMVSRFGTTHHSARDSPMQILYVRAAATQIQGTEVQKSKIPIYIHLARRAPLVPIVALLSP